MNAVKHFFKLLIITIVPLYLLLIFLNVLSVALGSIALVLDPILPTINTVAGLLLIPCLFLIGAIGIPHYKKCKKCGSRIRITYVIETGADASEPNKYEHYFDVKECLSCGDHASVHHKVERKNRHLRTW